MESGLSGCGIGQSPEHKEGVWRGLGWLLRGWMYVLGNK